jgi:hypothetical protein
VRQALRPPGTGVHPLVVTLVARAHDLGRDIAREVEEQVPVYRQWRELGHGDQLARAIEHVLLEFAGMVETGAHPSESMVFEMARTRARQGLPAHAILSAWRISGHELWRWLTGRFPEEFAPGGVGIEVWSRYLEFADHYVEQITDAFLETTQEERVHEAMEVRARVDDLVRGLPPEETEQSLKELGVFSREVLVAMCRAPTAGPDTNAEVVADYGRFLKELRLRTRMAVPWTMRSGSLLALVPALDGHFALVADAVPADADLRLGISKVTSVRSDLSPARQQAERALHATSACHPLNDLNRMTLLEVAAMQAPLQWEDIPTWLQCLLQDPRHSDEWETTAHSLFAQGGSVSAAAKALNVHTNTVYYRLETIRAVCGVDLRHPAALADLHLAYASRDFGILVVPV